MRRFEDLVAWQKARALTRAIYQHTSRGQFERDLGLCGQIQRAAVSVMSNLAEGFERGSSRDFHRFLVIAKASCAELRSQLYVALDNGYLTQSEFEALSKMSLEVSKVIGGLRAAVSRQR
ncbi:four helix bundle protein [Natronospira bacteriovora]|uniref:Four helix bundle protein n=1 Tax=Natronospira bacteriovora TaxID=3069753 RepID=A0ABU0W8P7_9GAMM|nr:four helix bundle protein [Natronospira sp. AB-CW4]MDQ2070123.1 four helix bundle protein [Natronospira sp. AB-CW4]